MWITVAQLVLFASVLFTDLLETQKCVCCLDKLWNYSSLKQEGVRMAGRIFGAKIPSFNPESGDSEFEGFLPQDIEDIIVPDISESDIEVSSVSSEESDHEENLGEERDFVEPGDITPVWSQNFQDVHVEQFLGESSANLPETFDPGTALPVDYFKLFFPDILFDEITNHTKQYAEWKIKEKQRQNPLYTDKVWKSDDVDSSRMCAYFGVNIMMGISALPRYEQYWSHDEFIGNTGIKKTMPLKVYEKLTEYLHVSDRENQPPRGSPQYDKLFKIRPVLNTMTETFAQYYKPSQDQAIDEGMVAFTGHLSYVQYLPAKPVKCGIKLWLRCDSNSAYLHQFDVYLGKSTVVSDHGLYFDVIDKLMEPLRGENYHIYYDNLCTSIPVMKHLLTNQLYSCGTVRMNKRFLPHEIKNPGKLQRGQSITMQDNTTPNLCATVWHDKKDVQVISTMYDP